MFNCVLGLNKTYSSNFLQNLTHYSFTLSSAEFVSCCNSAHHYTCIGLFLLLIMLTPSLIHTS